MNERRRARERERHKMIPRTVCPLETHRMQTVGCAIETCIHTHTLAHTHTIQIRDPVNDDSSSRRRMI